jgi:TPR repeat protein
MNDLGVRLLKGFGIEKNEKEAMTWIRKAADAGLPVAMLNLSVLEKEQLPKAASWQRKQDIPLGSSSRPKAWKRMGRSSRRSRLTRWRRNPGTRKQQSVAMR